MIPRTQLRAVLFTLVIVLSSVAVGTAATSGTAVAQPSGDVELQDTIRETAETFEVEIPELNNGDDPGWLRVRNRDNDADAESMQVREGDVVTISAEEIGGTEAGDDIEASLYADSDYTNRLDVDLTRVSEEQQPTYFEVTFESSTGNIEEGETYVMEVTVENTGDVSGTQSVGLFVNDEQVDSESLTLGPGESETIALEWQTEDGDSGEYGVSAESVNDAAYDSIYVSDAPFPNFEVTIDSENGPLIEGDTLVVETTVENTGDAHGEQVVELKIEDERVGATEVALDVGERDQISLFWETGDGDAGTHTATVASDDDSDVTGVTVHERSNFTVEITSTTSPVSEGDELEVTAFVENTGAETDSQSVTLTIDDGPVASETITLESGESTTIDLVWETEPGDAGEYVAEIASDDDSDTTDVAVNQAARFPVDIVSTTSPVTEGEDLGVTATVQNTGEETDTRPVELVVAGETVDATELTLEPGQSETVELTWATEDGDAGEHTATVETESGSDSTPVTVERAVFFAVEITSTSGPVVEAEPLDVTATIENTGESSDTQPIELRVDGATVDTTQLSLDGGESESVTLTWENDDAPLGSYTAVVASEDDSDAVDTSVNEPRPGELAGGKQVFEVEITSTNAPVAEGESLEVTAEVTNIGPESGTQTITLSSDGVERDSREITLDSQESRTLTFAWETGPGDAGEQTASAASETDDDSTTLTVTDGSDDGTPTFAVTINEVSLPEDGDGPFEVTASIENVADVEDTQTITLRTDGVERDVREMTLGPGESESVTFSWEQDPDEIEGDSIELEVASEDDLDTSSASLAGLGGGDSSSVSTTTWLGLLILIALLLVGYYYLRRRREEPEPPDPQEG